MSSHKDFAVVPDNVEGINPNHPCRSGAQVLDADAGIIERRCEKLAIVGYATSTRDLAPFDDPEYEIVGLNQLYRFIPRADFWADLHINWDEENVEGTDHEGWIRDCGIPVLMTQRHANLPTSVRYPIEAIIGVGTDYITSTVALLIAWGIHQGYKEIALFGIDLVVGTEYEFQKSCAEFWLGVAHGRGITVRIPPQSALLKHTHRYGYEREPESKLLRINEVVARKKTLEGMSAELQVKLRAFDGALHETERLQAEIANAPLRTVEEVSETLTKRLKWLAENRLETLVQLATMDGAAQESKFIGDLMQLRSRGADVAMPTGA